MSIVRKRLTPEASKQAALDAARDLLMEAGPQAVTLKAVAGRIGKTHANLLHHFGSASGLQRALATSLTQSICSEIAAVVIKSRNGDGNPRDVVDLAFDAFDQQGAGALASWMLLSGNEDALDPIVEAIHALVDDLAVGGHEDEMLHDDSLMLVLMALGDALLGAPLARALGLPRERARDIATRIVLSTLEQSGTARG